MTRARIQRSGTAAVELAVCLPFLLIVILGVWDVRRMVQAQQIIGNVTVVNLTNASRSDPTNCNQLDQWQVTVTVPYSTIRYSTVAQISSTTQITASANWFSSKDSPVTVTATIPTN